MSISVCITEFRRDYTKAPVVELREGGGYSVRGAKLAPPSAFTVVIEIVVSSIPLPTLPNNSPGWLAKPHTAREIQRCRIYTGYFLILITVARPRR